LVASVFAAYALSGLLPYAYLPWAARAHPTLVSGQLETLKGFIGYVSGSQWTSHGESYGWSFARVAEFPEQLFLELFAVGLAGLALGLHRLWRRQPELRAFLALF